jgi:dimethylargininase
MPPSRRLRAITRELSPAIARCELTHLAREPIDYARAVAQHEAYLQLLASLGIALTRLPAAAELPDAVFVEDAAIVLDELAVITRPGAAARRPELLAVSEALRAWRPIAQIAAPGTLDGGDVLRVERTLYVGLSSRSNAAGAAQLQALVAPHGYAVETVAVSGCLHLKSAVCAIDATRVLLNPAWCDVQAFGGFARLAIDPDEPFAANLLRLDDCVIMAAAFPRTTARLRAERVVVHTVDMSELAKAEGAVSCCSLLFADTPC